MDIKKGIILALIFIMPLSLNSCYRDPYGNTYVDGAAIAAGVGVAAIGTAAIISASRNNNRYYHGGGGYRPGPRPYPRPHPRPYPRYR